MAMLEEHTFGRFIILLIYNNSFIFWSTQTSEAMNVNQVLTVVYLMHATDLV